MPGEEQQYDTYMGDQVYQVIYNLILFNWDPNAYCLALFIY